MLVLKLVKMVMKLHLMDAVTDVLWSRDGQIALILLLVYTLSNLSTMMAYEFREKDVTQVSILDASLTIPRLSPATIAREDQPQVLMFV